MTSLLILMAHCELSEYAFLSPSAEKWKETPVTDGWMMQQVRMEGTSVVQSTILSQCMLVSHTQGKDTETIKVGGRSGFIFSTAKRFYNQVDIPIGFMLKSEDSTLIQISLKPFN